VIHGVRLAVSCGRRWCLGRGSWRTLFPRRAGGLASRCCTTAVTTGAPRWSGPSPTRRTRSVPFTGRSPRRSPRV